MRPFFWILVLFLGMPFAALAVDVAQDTTLVLPSDSSSYTLVSGSSFNTLTINNGSFEFSMSASQSITITSADKKNLTNNFQTATTCESSQSKLVITLGSGALPQTISVTPTGTCSAAAATTGGGGGGGTIFYNPEEGNPPLPIVATTTVVAPTPQPPPPVPTPAPVVVKPSPVALAVSPVFNKNLSFGSRGDDIKRLQELLRLDKDIYPEGLATGYYGNLTRNAVRKFQLKYGVIKNTTDPGNGVTGPRTRAKLAEVFGKAIPQAPQSEQEKIRALQDQIRILQENIQQLLKK